jgi:hypothetical protein
VLLFFGDRVQCTIAGEAVGILMAIALLCDHSVVLCGRLV